MAGSRSYERSYTPPPWWLAELRQAIESVGWTHAGVAAAASKAAGRDPPWDGSRVTKFLQGKNQTLELTLALADAVGIAPPVFEARSKSDAEEFRKLQRKLEGPS